MANSTLSRTSSSSSINSIEFDVELISRYDIVGERITPFDPHTPSFRDNTITLFSRLNYVISSADLRPFTSQESDPTSAKSNHHTELDAFTSQEGDPTSAKREYHARLIYDNNPEGKISTAFWAKRHHSTSVVLGIYYVVLTERELKAIRVWEDENIKDGDQEEGQEDGSTEDS
ncbi:hypothetical protein NA56DRAFT_709349 [Hyaloscypha hepaticicola]|uniref:Uncharacterized protein n=1 Tax=Hyaloscypha hepaticicola TaxID=2082293 RepID=A0A2J6PPL1_9HELO|nr:hypothetical protein NA56DRAFT_709349 [Hyaloscypha hepaticicola]